MGGMVAIFAPGLTIAKQGSLFFTVARVIFPYVLLISASSLYVGILNSAKKFGPGAFCPVILNLCLIFALFFDLQNPQSTLYLMSFAVIAAGSIQVVYLALVLYKKDLLPKKTSFIFDNNLKNFLKKFLPAAKNRYGWTPLHHVATKGHTEIVKSLIEKGAAVNAKNEDGWTILTVVDASSLFLKELQTVEDPEQKRKLIGKLFIDVFHKQSSTFSDAAFLLQGTL